MNLNNDNNGYESNDNDGFIGDNDPMFNSDNLPPITDEQMQNIREITEEPFTHPDSPFRSSMPLDPHDCKSVATAFTMANNWHITNWACYMAVMQEITQDLPPYLARRVVLALTKMNGIVVQSGDRMLQVGKAVANT